MRILLVGLLLAGCTVGTVNETTPDISPIVEGQTTKREVLERFGVPDSVFHTWGREVLIYTSEVERGMGLGAGYWGIRLRISNSHVGTDTTTVVLDEDGIVQRIHFYKGSELAQYDIWPFGN